MPELATKVRTSPLWKVLVLAFVAMCVQDILGTVMVIFEAQAGAAGDVTTAFWFSVLAGLFDVGGWIAGLICTALALDSIIRDGWRTRRSLALIVVVSVANFVGTIAGGIFAWGISTHPH